MYCVLSAQVNAVHTTPGSTQLPFLTVATKRTKGAPRGAGVDLPDWFMKLVSEVAEGVDETALGAALATAVGRDRPWDRSTVNRFVTNEKTTFEMAEAFCVLFSLPRPYHQSVTLEEAVEVQRIAARHASMERVTDEQRRRLAAVDQIRDSEEESAVDQTRPLQSTDERAGGRGWSRRAARRRAPTS